MIKSFEDLMKVAKEQRQMRLAVAAAEDLEVLQAVKDATATGLVLPVLVGDLDKIRDMALKIDFDLGAYPLIEAKTLEEAAQISVRMVHDGEADFLMKGLIDTSVLLKAVLDKTWGLRTDSQLSHVMIYASGNYHKLLFLTDGGMNITPTLEEKVFIVKNAVKTAKALGIDTVKVAALAAKEKVNPKMQATVDARALQDLSRQGGFGEGVILEGPLALDLAVSSKAAEVKGFESEIENVAVQFTDLIEYDDFMVTAASGEVAFNLNAAINAAGGTERGFNPDALFTIGDVDTGAFTITNNSDIPVVVSFSDDDSENTPLSLEAVEAYEIPVGETYGFYFDLETTELSDQDALGGTLSVRGGDAIQ